ncbi:restriction endonuclease [Bacillus luti]|uniref:restriction endonuclease n=1 Tax=Bacillus luti TaxID=2026191 RepID=UPI0012E8581B|nr:restriction endonuclease [Bacillus luti]
MERLILPIKKKISKYIMENFNDGKIELSDYLVEKRQEIVKELKLNIEPDEIIFTIADTNSLEFLEFVKVLKGEIRKASGRSKVNLISDHLTYYIENSILGSSVNGRLKRVLEDKLGEVSKWKNGHTIYEKFCALFLQDFKYSNINVTASSNDLGVDIIGEYIFREETNNLLLEFLLPRKISLLSQVKFYNTLVDTSYIRKLIGDSLFIRFDREIYPNTRHNPVCLIFFSYVGFTEEAKKFAQDNKVCLIESNFMLDLICSEENCVGLKSVEFLLNVTL